jgi:general secretion pathway protein B
MSLILEALKKAEQQHRIGEVPKIGSRTIESDSGIPWWAGVALLALFALAMVGVGLYLGDETPELSDEHGAYSATMPQALPVPRAVAPVPGQGETPAVSDPLPERPNVAVQQAPQAEPSAGVQSTTAVVVPPVAKPSPKVWQERENPLPEPPMPPKDLADLPVGFIENLPQFNIDIHSYAAQPGKSYVLINMEKYREGDYLAEGPLLSEILPDGVVLEHLGERFILPIGNH